MPGFEVSNIGVMVTAYSDASAPARTERHDFDLSFVSRMVVVNDALTRRRFMLACAAPSATRERSEAETRTIANSFRILPPNAATPSP